MSEMRRAGDRNPFVDGEIAGKVTETLSDG